MVEGYETMTPAEIERVVQATAAAGALSDWYAQRAIVAALRELARITSAGKTPGKRLVGPRGLNRWADQIEAGK